MSEVNPFEYQEGDPVFKMDFTNAKLYLHPKNTFIYEYSKQIEGDHIFIAHDLKDGEVMGYYMFRKMLEEAGVEMPWNKLVTNLGEMGCRLFNLEYMDEADQAMYEKHFGTKPERIPETPETPEVRKPLETFDVTPRKERVISYLGHLLEYEHILPEDFHTEGGVAL